jgi:hypothetical protein
MPLQQAHMVAEYMQGSFTVYDALDMAETQPEDFRKVFTVALAIKVANMSMAKKAHKKRPGE